jgi:hypothetical protein
MSETYQLTFEMHSGERETQYVSAAHAGMPNGMVCICVRYRPSGKLRGVKRVISPSVRAQVDIIRLIGLIHKANVDMRAVEGCKLMPRLEG